MLLPWMRAEDSGTRWWRTIFNSGAAALVAREASARQREPEWQPARTQRHGCPLYELVANLKTVRSLCVIVPGTLLAHAVIE
jgi:hypothetical protein